MTIRALANGLRGEGFEPVTARPGIGHRRRLSDWWGAWRQFPGAKLSASLPSKIVCLALCCAGIATVAAQSTASLKLKQTIPLSGVEGRIDHFAFDPAGERLFVCALGNNTVEIIDLRKGERIHSITGFGSPQGILYTRDPDRLFVANDKRGILKIFEGKTFEPRGELNFKDDADNVRYDDATKKVYVGFGSGGLAVVSGPNGKPMGSIQLS